jgi:flagellar biosynthetic protein FliR
MDPAIIFLLALTRITAVVMTAPVLGSRAIPFRFRLALAGILTATTFALIPAERIVSSDSNLFSAFYSEIIVGIMLGLGVMIVFAAAQIAGTVIGQMAGIQIADNLDPNSGQPTSPVSQMFGVLSLAAFAVIGGPELVIAATLDTFASFPIGSTLEMGSILDLIPRLLQQSFILTLRAVAPAVASLLSATIVIGWISRTYPQMNLLSLGLSSNLIVMFLAISFTMGGCVWLFVDDLGEFIAMISDSIYVSEANVSQTLQAPQQGVPQ